ncbi:hypothetical protein JXA56_02845 [Candidatus Micrarchaeota archaeon]|nr:hypothetical protein [Candidatus Micrarchaeota archaeon]
MGKRLRAALLISGWSVNASAGAFTGYHIAMDTKSWFSQQSRTLELVERFEKCPSTFKATKECYTGNEASEKLETALKSRNNGNFENAGILFAELNRFNDAREMAGKCSENGNSSGKRRILNEIAAREKAMREIK